MIGKVTAGILAAAVSLAACTSSISAADIQQNLDRTVKLDKQELLIGEVFEKITRQTDVPFIIEKDTLACLPYGSRTKLAVMLKDVTVRNALTQMLSPLALQWTVENDGVKVSPSEGLFRMGRRATYEELQILGGLYSNNMNRSPQDPVAGAMAQLRKITGEPGLQITFDSEQANRSAAYANADLALPTTAAQWLDEVGGRQNTWYLNGDEIVIIAKKKQIERQLQRLVSVRYQNEQLALVLMDLARQARVQLTLQPGVLQALPPETRSNSTLLVSDTTIAQALDLISANTGLSFVHTSDGISVEGARGTATTQPRRPSLFLVVEVPGPEGTKTQMFIRGDDLPADVQKALEGKKADFIKKLRAQIVTELPQTEPATRQYDEAGER